MKVKALIEKLKEINPDFDVRLMLDHCKDPEKFSFTTDSIRRTVTITKGNRGT